MKCLDKKRIKMKQGETLALNERIMLSLVSTGQDCPFIVCMTYAFQSPDKLCFILDLMNGGDLHYHLSQHGVFTEQEMLFYASEVILGLEHMHNRYVVYRDLKPANILLDENGHVRVSDLGLACDFSKKKPHASVLVLAFFSNKTDAILHAEYSTLPSSATAIRIFIDFGGVYVAYSCCKSICR
ncbi:hypothetical protein Y032_0029g1915 [Ancylostoma ceylanicum]|nr:hypothetical protein Y032_0029g1915 [Ancylostoma ceylanicum]